MTDTNESVTRGILVEEELQFSLVELCRACRADSEELIVLVREGVLEPSGDDPINWRFGGEALRRARIALRLTHDLELNASGTALVLELLDEIATLRSRLRRLGDD